jgi:hypothetical protein
MNQTTIKQTPRREYFKLRATDTARVWVRGDYDRATKRYECQAADDMNEFCYLKGTRAVFIGFTY